MKTARRPGKKTVYLDSAATSFPKPDKTVLAVVKTLKMAGANPHRGAHEFALRSERILLDARETIASFFNIPEPGNVVFTQNVTYALNIALKGYLGNGDKVLLFPMQHNSVARPLAKLARERNIKICRVPADRYGYPDLAEYRKLISMKPRLVVVNHASNINGVIQPLRQITAIASSAMVPVLVDAAQTAGVVPIDFVRDRISILCCTGHKSLLGPQGVGFFAIDVKLRLDTLIEGGTGTASEKESMPDLLPERFEPGTVNLPGIAGLAESIKYLRKEGWKISARELKLAEILIAGLQSLPGVKVYAGKSDRRLGVISFTVEGYDPAEIGDYLDREYRIAVRVGLHCAPDAHKTLGTYPRGTVRFAVGWKTSLPDIRLALKAVKELTGRARRGG